MAFVAGTKLGPYEILSLLGAGGMGEVYRARDNQLHRDVAIKILFASAFYDERARKRFRNEALTLAKLNHPYIASIHEFSAEKGVDYIVMEYVPGESLAQTLSRGTLPERQVVSVSLQIAEALEEAHENGVVHLDLKPGNIMLTPKGWTKVLDFGLADRLQPIDERSTAVLSQSSPHVAGTLPYMAPEQLLGLEKDARVDIYGFGAVLYEMTTGHRPFTSILPARLTDDILHHAPPPPSSYGHLVSPELERIIGKCLEKDPENRYQTAKELKIDLRRLSAQSSAVLPTADHTPPLRSPWWRRHLPLLTLAVLLLLTAATGAGLYVRRANSAHSAFPKIHALAVLPFENSSGDPQQDYFSQGMTDELTTQLGRIAALRVISRTSANQFQGKRVSLPKIAKQLKVDAVVEGTVMRSDDHVRISARVVRASTDQLIWASDYERETKDIFALQQEVATTIANEVQVSLTPEERARLSSQQTINPAAHEEYLKGRFLNKGTDAQQKLAKEHFEQAIKIDPNYAPAYAGLADYYFSSPEVSPLVSMPRAKEMARKALELDPNLSDAHLELALIHFYADWDWNGADQEFQRALALNPNDAEAHRTRSYFLSALGRQQESFSEIQEAQLLDPLSIWTQITAGYVHYFARDYDAAIDQCHKALELDPNSVGAFDCLGAIYLAKGQTEDATSAASKATTLSTGDPSRLVGLGRAYAVARKRADALGVVQKLDQLSQQRYVSQYFPATIYAALGDKQEAFNRLEHAFRDRDGYLAWLKVDFAVDPLRNDPRFQNLVHRVALPE
jgi:serine/threonine protein kinase/tetratricopeptide (TPR) repeat protein